MTRQFYCRASLAASLLLPALTGCVFHKTSPPPVVAIAPPPAPAPVPLYSAELSEAAPTLPDLPSAPSPNAQPAPPPKSEVEFTKKQRPGRRARGRKGEIELAERETREREAREAREKEASPSSATTADTSVAAGAEHAPPLEKVTAPTPTGDTTQPTSIGQLTAGPTTDADASRRQASDLIQNTQRGINSLHRSLSGDQEKTVAQIRSFLMQAQRAMHNGDIDGASTLATKAKLLLDELNGST